jgi:hypothetical protein
VMSTTLPKKVLKQQTQNKHKSPWNFIILLLWDMHACMQIKEGP